MKKNPKFYVDYIRCIYDHEKSGTNRQPCSYPLADHSAWNTARLNFPAQSSCMAIKSTTGSDGVATVNLSGCKR